MHLIMTTKEKIEVLLQNITGNADRHLQLNDTFYDLGLDELDVVELIMELESTFSIEIDDKEVDNFRSVQDVVCYLEKHNITSA